MGKSSDYKDRRKEFEVDDLVMSSGISKDEAQKIVAEGADNQAVVSLDEKPAPILRLQHVSEFYEDVKEDIEWLWEPLLPAKSLAAVVAFMKVGKSTMVFDLARAVSRGEPYLEFKTKQAGVAILSLEEDPALMKARLRRYGVSDKDPIWIEGNPSLWQYSKREKLYEELQEFIFMHRIGLVIIDSLSKFAMFENENDNAEVTRFLTKPLELARTTGATMLFLHHEPKAGGLGGRNVRGGGGILAALDVSLSLQNTKTGSTTDRTLEILGRYQSWSPGDLLLGFDRETDRYYYKGLANERSMEVYKRKVLKELDEDWETVKVIAECAELEYEPARKALKSLAEEGKAELTKEGVKLLYRLPREAHGEHTT